MTYYESAEGVLVTPARALRMLDEHGVEDYYQFWDEVQTDERGLYDAQDILTWLGY